MENEYCPTPIDTTGVVLAPEILEVVEVLARHTHDLWALQRLQDGWIHGGNRCDETRTHPCLVPYERLPDSEKQYDRNSAIGTVSALIALGYTLQHNGSDDGV